MHLHVMYVLWSFTVHNGALTALRSDSITNSTGHFQIQLLTESFSPNLYDTIELKADNTLGLETI